METASTQMVKTSVVLVDKLPELLLLQIGSDLESPNFEASFFNFRVALEEHFSVVPKTSTEAAKEFLSVRNPKAILVVDGALGGDEDRLSTLQLAKYVRSGGTVVQACNFASFLTPPRFSSLFNVLGLTWESRDIPKSSFVLNPEMVFVFGEERFQTLDEQCHMEGTVLDHVPAIARVYFPDLKDAFFRPESACTKMSSIAFTKVDQGFFGFCGDTGNNPVSEHALLVMLSTFTSSLRAEVEYL